MRALAALILLAACSSPALRFSGVTPVRLTVAGHDFDVYAARAEAQVIRVNPVWLPDRAEVMAAGVIAAERATGCRASAARVTGDAAILTVPLVCGG